MSLEPNFFIAFASYFKKELIFPLNPSKLNDDILFCSLAIKSAFKDPTSIAESLVKVLDDLNEESIKKFNEVSEINWLENSDNKRIFVYIIQGLIDDLYYWDT